ncbi:MAG: DUF1351 domain-containing protein [Gemmiger sp.]
MVEMKIASPQQGQPLPAVQWNYLEVRGELEKSIATYKDRAYTPETLPAAKADRAALNKLSAAVAAKRREVRAMYLHPFEQFERECKEIESMIAQVSGMVDAQIKFFESAEAEKKRAAIAQIYEDNIGDMRELLPLSALENHRWMNKTYRLDAIEEELKTSVNLYRQGVQSLREVCGQDADACISEYLSNGGNLPRALAKHKALEQVRAADARRASAQAAQNGAERARMAAQGIGITVAQSAQPAENSTHGADEPVVTVDFRVTTTRPKLMALRAWLMENNITYGRVPSCE